jgi:hypothetical protein
MTHMKLGSHMGNGASASLRGENEDPFRPSMQRRTFLRSLSAGTILIALGGGAYVLAD